MRAVVFSTTALFRLSQYAISREWFESYGLPADAKDIKRVVLEDIVYLIDSKLVSDVTPIIVIQLEGRYPVFGKDTNSAVLDRIITVARSVYTTSVAIPPGWRQYREGHRFSIAASSIGSNWRARILFDTHPNQSSDLVVFGRTEGTIELSRLLTPLALHKDARSYFADAILTPEPKGRSKIGAGIVLSQRLPQGFAQGATLQQWHKSKLTDEQRGFVDKPYDGPVRLRGAAGTGKTLSLVIKFLKDAEAFERGEVKRRLGFITHSQASADLVRSIAESLDPMGLMYGQAKHCTLEVRTLYDLAHAQLKFTLENLTPLSLDGREGRRIQRELIETALNEMKTSPILALQYADVSPEIFARWLPASGPERGLVTDIMNEFANVLDAEGIRVGEELGERYAKGSYQRPVWLMRLATERDRRFVLEVHRIYRRILGEMDTLSVDQMVADFNTFLSSNRWDRRRSRDGYDALFVDELHLFTYIERQTLHKLIKMAVEDDGRPKRPPIFMAYDMKQSPRGLLIHDMDGDPGLFSPATKLQNSELVLLNKVFRYTPQIAEFLADLDASFPAINIPDDWNSYQVESEVPSGDVPKLTIYKDDTALFKSIFSAAHQCARSIQGGGRRVAVLCPNEEIFDRYLKVARGQFEGRFVSIVSRELTTELQHAGKRFIFSMPEYVAGLQFDTVFVIHVDASAAPKDASIDARQRFISNVYLGSSRAERTLNLSTSLSEGGPSDVLDMALERKSLERVLG
jgi:hypothetical protein